MGHAGHQGQGAIQTGHKNGESGKHRLQAAETLRQFSALPLS